MNDRREQARQRVLLAGKVMLPGGGVIDCTVRDRSECGARIKVQSVIGIPDRFQLLIETTATMIEVCVEWRKQNELGVRIVGPPID
jgi:hypothetical protein